MKCMKLCRECPAPVTAQARGCPHQEGHPSLDPRWLPRTLGVCSLCFGTLLLSLWFMLD